MVAHTGGPGDARATRRLNEPRPARVAASHGVPEAVGDVPVAQVREDARKVIRIGDGLSRSVDQLLHEANGLESEVFRFRLPSPRRGGTVRIGTHQAPSAVTITPISSEVATWDQPGPADLTASPISSAR